MFIKNLKLRDFRNYKRLDLDFSKRFNIIYGDNGQGKTNILEAIFLCASGRSHRTSKDSELINIGNGSFFITLDLNREDLDKIIEFSYSKEEKKKVKINEIPVKKIGDLIGNLNTVLFSPEDLLIIKEGPSERRRFIDITISQLKPSYFFDLQQYIKVLSQRNNLLKELQNKRSLIDTLDVWDSNLLMLGSRIIKVRHEFLKKLNLKARENHSKLTNGKEVLSLKYSPSFRIENLENINDIEKGFEKILANSRERDIARMTTHYGPQRDDFELFLNELNLKLYGSQGQQRTAILSMKLSEIDIMKESTGKYPILLLDDVMSELDINRQEYLMNNLENVQTLITCTDKDFFDRKINGEIKFIKIKNGSIEETHVSK